MRLAMRRQVQADSAPIRQEGQCCIGRGKASGQAEPAKRFRVEPLQTACNIRAGVLQDRIAERIARMGVVENEGAKAA